MYRCYPPGWRYVFVMCIVFVTLLLVSAIHISGVVIGSRYEHEIGEVCSADGVGVNLTSWLVYGGAVGIAINTLLFLYISCVLWGAAVEADDLESDRDELIDVAPAMCFEADKECNPMPYCCCPVGLFWLAWFVVGIVIIAGVPEQCRLLYGGTVYATAVAALVLEGIPAIGAVAKCFHK